MKKALSTTSYLGLFILALIGLIFLLFLLSKEARITEQATETDLQCSLSLLFSQSSNILTFGLAEVPPECRVRRMDINREYLNNIIRDYNAEQAIKDYSQSSNPSLRLLSLALPEQDPNSKYKWAFLKTVSDSLNNCRKKVLADLKLLEDKAHKISLGNLCIVCYLLYIDPEIRDTILESESRPYLSVFQNFIEFNKPKGSKKTYFDLLFEAMDYSTVYPDINDQKEIVKDVLHYTKLRNIIKDPDDAIAIVYSHYPSDLRKDPRALSFYSYKNLTTTNPFNIQDSATVFEIYDYDMTCKLIIV